MKALTPDQLADILLQKPDRVTRDVLDHRSLLERWSDETLTRDEEKKIARANPGPLEKWRRRLITHFEARAKVAEEHPRSLRRAALELKALGFSNEQIKEIKEMSYRFMLANCEPNMPLNIIFKEDYPDRAYEWCDRAFLGAALTGPYGDSPKDLHSLEQYLARIDALLKDPDKNGNSVIPPQREEMVNQLFASWVERYLKERRQNAHVSLTQPASPRSRFNDLKP